VSIDTPPPPTLTELRAHTQRARHARPRRAVVAPRPPEGRVDRLITRAITGQAIWLAPVLIVQAWLSFRLNNSLEEDEALYINAGHQLIAHVLHGTPAPAFGTYFSGVPFLYSVPAAMLDHVGGVLLVHAVNTLTVMLATVFCYLTTRRLFSHGTALIAASVFAVYPATIFVGRFASFDAPCLLLLSIGLYLAVRAADRPIYAVLTGPCLVLATAEKYFALAFIPSIFAVLLLRTVQRQGPERGIRTAGLALGSLLVAGAIAAFMIFPQDWHGLVGTSLNRTTLLPESRAALIRDCVGYMGGLTLAGMVGLALLHRRRSLGGLLLVTALIPAFVQIRFGEAASLHKNLSFGVLFIAPLVGVAGMALLRRGRALGPRVAVAGVGAFLVMSSGMGTSQAMVYGWPNSDRIDTLLAQYVHPGPHRYLVDDSQIPAYYLSGISNYDQWATTYDAAYVGPNGAQVMRDQLANGTFTVFLYRDQGSTIGLDRQMLTILHRRYTLVAKMPLSKTDANHFWYLWVAELPR
jgi:hypothetical protein